MPFDGRSLGNFSGSIGRRTGRFSTLVSLFCPFLIVYDGFDTPDSCCGPYVPLTFVVKCLLPPHFYALPSHIPTQMHSQRAWDRPWYRRCALCSGAWVCSPPPPPFPVSLALNTRRGFLLPPPMSTSHSSQMLEAEDSGGQGQQEAYGSRDLLSIPVRLQHCSPPHSIRLNFQ